jgi:hypothetical protein
MTSAHSVSSGCDVVWADGRGMTTTHSLPLSGGDVGMCRNMESIGGVDEVTSKMASIAPRN